jgi:murein L,D-transpeptidase YafK
MPRLFPVLALLLTSVIAAADPHLWLRVDTGAGTLSVMDGYRVLEVFDGIAIGRGGAGRDKRAGDQKTPLGRYHIVQIRNDSPFHRFLMLDYPSTRDAERARRDGGLKASDYVAILTSSQAGRLPPQETALGGYVGLHGLGEGDPRIHAAFNWTQGCVALTNEQIDRLARRVAVGTVVVIE